jgi:hypothetical protein
MSYHEGVLKGKKSLDVTRCVFQPSSTDDPKRVTVPQSAAIYFNINFEFKIIYFLTHSQYLIEYLSPDSAGWDRESERARKRDEYPLLFSFSF